jgi:hypothetical protein
LLIKSLGKLIFAYRECDIHYIWGICVPEPSGIEIGHIFPSAGYNLYKECPQVVWDESNTQVTISEGGTQMPQI